jgi:hypothetical protein
MAVDQYAWISQLIATFGRTVTVTKAAAQVDDANKPWRGKVTAVQYTDPGHIPVPATVPTTTSPKAAIVAYKLNEIDGDLVKTGDCKAYIRADGTNDLTTFNTLTDADGGIWRIGKQCQKVQINATDLVYILQLRR